MKRALGALLVVLLSGAGAAATAQSEGRLSSDFEIAAAQRQLRNARSANARTAAHLNLGDIWSARADRDRARNEYLAARDEAERERIQTRKSSNLSGYARATSYSALAHAKLNQREPAFERFEESVRYFSDVPSTWNLYASGMLVLGEPDKSAAAARNAVHLATAAMRDDPSEEKLLDLNIYRYTLASALAGKERSNAIEALREVVSSLTSSRFNRTREEVRSSEEFEILSSVQNDSSAYVSLLTRSRLKLASLYEAEGSTSLAAAQYRAVLDVRSDEPTALRGLARLESSAEERREYFAEAFAANPFSYSLIEEYEAFLANNDPATAGGEPGSGVRRLVEALQRRNTAAALELSQRLLDRYPNNDVVLALSARTATLGGDHAKRDALASRISDRELRNKIERPASTNDVNTLIASARRGDEKSLLELARAASNETLSAEERTKIDGTTLQLNVRPADAQSANGNTIMQTFLARDIRLRTSLPTEFRGSFQREEVVELSFIVVGASRDTEGEFILIDPRGVSR